MTFFLFARNDPCSCATLTAVQVRDAETSTEEASINARASRVGERVLAVVKPAWEAFVASVPGE